MNLNYQRTINNFSVRKDDKLFSFVLHATTIQLLTFPRWSWPILTSNVCLQPLKRHSAMTLWYGLMIYVRGPREAGMRAAWSPHWLKTTKLSSVSARCWSARMVCESPRWLQTMHANVCDRCRLFRQDIKISLLAACPQRHHTTHSTNNNFLCAA